MNEADNVQYSGNGAGPEPGPPRRFPGAPGGASRPVPLGAPPPRGGAPTLQATPAEPAGAVTGRITIADTVAEKIAVLATTEVAGVTGTEDVSVRISDNDVAVELSIVVEYGSVVLDVARAAQANVWRVVGRMLGLRVSAVDITVTDVRLPEE